MVVPLHVRFGTTELVDRQELSVEDFWARCATSDDSRDRRPVAGSLSIYVCVALGRGGRRGRVRDFVGKAVGDEPGGRPGGAALGDGAAVTVLDSRSVTMGQGLVALAAAEAACDGAGMDVVVAEAESTRGRLSVFGVIDTLENLRRGGRIGGATAALGTLLSIKPVIEVRDGAVEQESRQRTRAKSLKYLADKVRSAGPLERLAVVSARAPDFGEFLERWGTSVPQSHVWWATSVLLSARTQAPGRFAQRQAGCAERP